MRPATGAKCLPVAAIRSSPHPRVVDESGLCDLAASMHQNGLLHPIVVYPAEGDTFILITGERRLRAARVLAWETIPATIRQEPTEQEARTWSLVENLQRQDLNPIEGAQAMRALYEAGMPQGQIARQIGRTQGYVSNRLRLLRLPARVQEQLAAGRLSVEWGDTLLAWAQEPEQCEVLAWQAEGKGLRLSELRARAKAEGRIQERGTKGGEGAPPRPEPSEGSDRSDPTAAPPALADVLAAALAAVPARQDCRRLALLAYEGLCRLTPSGSARRLTERGLAALIPLIDRYRPEREVEAWEALAAQDPETLLALAGDALLAYDLESQEMDGEAPRRARWYAGLEERDG